MTAPSNANTSGLEVVAYLEVSKAGMGRRACLHQRKETPTMLRRWSSEPLVTAASAQARIAELDEQLAQAAMMIIGSTTRAAAAEARADRLAKALRKSREGWTNALELGLLPPQHEETAADLRDEADEALQQETQP